MVASNPILFDLVLYPKLAYYQGLLLTERTQLYAALQAEYVRKRAKQRKDFLILYADSIGIGGTVTDSRKQEF